MIISVNYTLVWQHKEYHEYQWTQEGKCFNIKRGKLMKLTSCGGSLGWCLRGKFYSRNQLRKKIVKLQP